MPKDVFKKRLIKLIFFLPALLWELDLRLMKDGQLNVKCVTRWNPFITRHLNTQAKTELFSMLNFFSFFTFLSAEEKETMKDVIFKTFAFANPDISFTLWRRRGMEEAWTAWHYWLGKLEFKVMKNALNIWIYRKNMVPKQRVYYMYNIVNTCSFVMVSCFLFSW